MLCTRLGYLGYKEANFSSILVQSGPNYISWSFMKKGCGITKMGLYCRILHAIKWDSLNIFINASLLASLGQGRVSGSFFQKT